MPLLPLLFMSAPLCKLTHNPVQPFSFDDKWEVMLQICMTSSSDKRKCWLRKKRVQGPNNLGATVTPHSIIICPLVAQWLRGKLQFRGGLFELQWDHRLKCGEIIEDSPWPHFETFISCNIKILWITVSMKHTLGQKCREHQTSHSGFLVS